MDTSSEKYNVKIPASAISHLRHSKHPDKIRTIIGDILRVNDPEGYAKHTRWSGQKQTFDDYEDMDDAKHNIRMANFHKGYNAVRKLQKQFLDSKMCSFGNNEETKSRDGISKLLAIKKWSLTKFQDRKQYTKTFPCEVNGEQISILVSGRLDGECAHRNTHAVVEVKNRFKGLLFHPRESEVCQVRMYMELTGYEHGFLFERHVDETENISVVPLSRKDKPDFVNDIFNDGNFKKNVATVLRCLRDENEFARIFDKQFNPSKNENDERQIRYNDNFFKK